MRRRRWQMTTTAKATTDRAKKLETDIGKVKAKLEAPQTEAVGHANPLGNALAKLIGSAADVLTAWQQAVVAAVFELCLVGVMVIYELLGQGRQTPAAVTAVRFRSPIGFLMDLRCPRPGRQREDAKAEPRRQREGLLARPSISSRR